MRKTSWIAAWIFLGLSLAAGGQSVEVVAPNGGEIWVIGENRTIQWGSSGVAGDVRISLVDPADNLAGLIAIVPAATGTYSWHVGDLSAGTAPTGQYRVRVKVVGQQVADKSDGLFSIVAVVQPTPVITVTSPNGGESWELGTTHPVTWTSANVTEHLRISLVRSNGDPVGTIAEGLPPGSSPYSWSAGRFLNGTNAPLAADYKIRVQAMGEQGGDSSNGVFSIVFNPALLHPVDKFPDIQLKPPLPSVTVCITSGKTAPVFGDRDIHVWVKNNTAVATGMLHLEFYIEGKGTNYYSISLGPNELRKNTRNCTWSTSGQKTIRAKLNVQGSTQLAEVEGWVQIYLHDPKYQSEYLVQCSDGTSKNEADIQ